MSVEAEVAVLRDWRDDHAEEHKTVWRKIDDNTIAHTDFIRSIERVETKLAIYTSLGVAVGSLLGSVIGALIIKFITGHS